ncbi:MAG: glycoside hydrolase family 95 protein, partial [Bacteroidales bacterium]|nr:glycoside hydrolase family 95 protein [Bacteroidales bacterium]
TVEYESDGVTFRREIFASAPDEVIVIRLSASEKNSLNLELSLDRPGDAEQVVVEDNRIIMNGFAQHEGRGTRFSSIVHVGHTGGSLTGTGTGTGSGSGNGSSSGSISGTVTVTGMRTDNVSVTDSSSSDSESSTVTGTSASLLVKDATTVLITVAGRTDFWGGDPLALAEIDLARLMDEKEKPQSADRKMQQSTEQNYHYSYEQMKERHINDYRELFDRVELTLNEPDTLNLPVNHRLEKIKAGASDPHLTELYFQFGRYLLISSSRQANFAGTLQGAPPGSRSANRQNTPTANSTDNLTGAPPGSRSNFRPGALPANLQGIWEPTLSPPWNADYHININLQMNYWPSLVTNLAECQFPLFDFVEGLRERGRITARETYGARGFVAHHTTDAW